MFHVKPQTELSEIIDRMRKYAPSLRGTGPYASDASYNRTLQDAAKLEEIEKELIRLRIIAKMADRLTKEKSNGN
jgi:hypothetical protein